MADYDVFNGDADGICALLQLRRAEPRRASLVTGVKRDIRLLERVDAAAGDRVTVLDVSLDSNRAALLRVLAAGAEVFYVDHHAAGDVPASGGLRALLDPAPDACTSTLVNEHLGGSSLGWAVVGAFGDNLGAAAERLARPLALDRARLGALQELGTCINYNGYGASLDDLHFQPAELYGKLAPYPDPFAFMAQSREDFEKLRDGYRADMAEAAALAPECADAATAVFILPDAAWARRVSGVYGNGLANANPARGHAVLTEKADGNYLVSVRAPLDDRGGADELCRRFPGGGGRQAAAGINDLPADMLGRFVDEFRAFYRQRPAANVRLRGETAETPAGRGARSEHAGNR